ncbi:MAG: gliding motility-associated C-terminal domain-containing protein [Saprospiraceae bacterium]|nr:gliding motility-associated C-terminal domain-containing protein [Saprospiraceae bacterium]
MTKNYYLPLLFMLAFCILLPATLLANGIPLNGGPGQPDSTSLRMGHCNPVTEIIEYDCETRTITLGAFILWTWTGIREPTSGMWSNGQFAHKITVTPPGSWSWDPTFTGCEASHWQNTFTEPGSFFDGPLGINTPPIFCYGQEYELTLNNPTGYNFPYMFWTPASIDGSVLPYNFDEPGEYTLTLLDQLGCPIEQTVNIVPAPALYPTISGPGFLCPEGDTSMLAVQQNFTHYDWSTGDTINPVVITEPGLYQVTVTDQHGCTGEQLIGVQNAEVGEFPISLTAAAICPGQLDTLRVVGGFSQYLWSNGAIGIRNIVSQPGVYSVTVTNSFGCTGTGSVTVGALSSPSLAISETPLCPGGGAVLTAIGDSLTQFIWSNGTSGNVISINSAGTYSVSATGPSVCPVQAQIQVLDAPAPTIAIAPADSLDCNTQEVELNATGSSSGAAFTLEWTTVDGYIASGANSLLPVVNAAGTYQLLITNNTTGCTATSAVTVAASIETPPTPVGIPEILTCAVSSITLGPLLPPSGNFSVAWSSASGGNIVSGQNTWNPVVDAPGAYLLVVTDLVNGCSAIGAIKISEDIAAPVAQIDPPSMITCTVASVPLSGAGSSVGAAFSYEWTASNGGTLAGPANSLQTLAGSAGTYTLVVNSLENGCSSSATVTVATDDDLPLAIIENPPVLTCDIQEIALNAGASSAGPGYSYAWSGPGIVQGANSLQPLVNTPGIYVLTIMNTDNNCSASVSTLVEQNILPPIASAGNADTLRCNVATLELNGAGSSQGGTYSYLWTSTSNGIDSGANTLTPTVSQAGAYILTIWNTANGCSAQDTVQIFEDVLAPIANIALPGLLSCSATQIFLDAVVSNPLLPQTYTWSGPGIVSGQGTPGITINQPGTYSLQITHLQNNCTDITSVTVAQDIVPPPAFAGADGILNCYNPVWTIGSPDNLVSPDISLQWSNADGWVHLSNQASEVLVQAPGTYYLLATNLQNGCISADTVLVVQDNALPMIDAGPGFELNCQFASFVLQGSADAGSSLLQYVWSSSNGQFIADSLSLQPTVTAPGVYVLTAINIENGCIARDSVSITLSDDVPLVQIESPAVFSCTQTQFALNATGSSAGTSFSYQWLASNGGNIISGENTLQPLISSPGNYTLWVTNLTSNCSATQSVAVSANLEAPVLMVNAGGDLTCLQTSQTAASSVVSSASSQLAFLWSDGQTDATIQVVQPGDYFVTVTDLFNGCTTTGSMTIEADTQPPLVVIAPVPDLNCQINTITLDAGASSQGSDFTIQWTSANGGNIVSGDHTLQPLVNSSGTYTLLITDESNGCTRLATALVATDTVPPLVQTATDAVLDCRTQSIELSGTGSSQGSDFSITWSTADGNILSGEQTLFPSVDQPGVYVLTIVDLQNGCSANSQVLVTQNIQPPLFAIATPDQLNCNITSISLNAAVNFMGNAPVIQWTTADGNILNGANTLTPEVDAPGVYQLLIVNQENGCADSAQVLVLENIVPPVITVQQGGILTCNIQQLNLSASANTPVTLWWQTDDGNILSGASTPQPLVDQPGSYEVIATNIQNGCSSAADVIVEREMNVPVDFDLSLTPPLCNRQAGQLVFLSTDGGVGPFVYSIDGGQNFSDSPEADQLAHGEYLLVVKDNNGCTTAQTLVVPEPIAPAVELPATFDLLIGESLQIQALLPPPFLSNQIESVVWTPTTGLVFTGNTVQELLAPFVSPLISTVFTVKIVTPEGCTAEARTSVRVDRQIDVYAPNVILPDDPNGENYAFTLFTRKGSVNQIKQLQIYDRWGEQIWVKRNFLPDDPSIGWDGRYNDQHVNPGVFVWWAEIELIDGRSLLMKGDLTVVR